MSEAPQTSRTPVKWLDGLERSKAQIAGGQTVPLLPVLEELRASAERLEASMGVVPDDADSSQAR